MAEVLAHDVIVEKWSIWWLAMLWRVGINAGINVQARLSNSSALLIICECQSIFCCRRPGGTRRAAGAAWPRRWMATAVEIGDEKYIFVCAVVRAPTPDGGARADSEVRDRQAVLPPGERN